MSAIDRGCMAKSIYHMSPRMFLLFSPMGELIDPSSQLWKFLSGEELELFMLLRAQ
jgi:hypothetical protein